MNKTTRKFSKITAAVLSAIMAASAITAVPIVASAAETSCQSVSVGTTITLSVTQNSDIRYELQNALDTAKNSATAANPYTIVIPSGTYNLSRGVWMYSNTTISAYGAHIVKSYTGSCMLQLGDNTAKSGYTGYSNVALKGGNWDGNCNSSSYNSTGFSNLRFAHASNLTLQDVSVTNNVDGHHLEIGGVKGITIKNCTFSGYKMYGSSGGREAIQLDVMNSEAVFGGNPNYDDSLCENVEISGCTFNNVFRAIGSHNAVVGKYYNNINVFDNNFSNITDYALFACNWKNAKIYGNTMSQVGAGIDMRYMLSSIYNNAAPSTAQGVVNSNSNIQIYDNNITLNTSSPVSTVLGIRLSGENVTSSTSNPNSIPLGNYKLNNATVRNNTITGRSKYGIRLDNADYCTVADNTVNSSANNSTVSSSRSLSLSTACNNTITGNSFKNLRNTGSNSVQVENSSNNNTFTNNNIDNVVNAGFSINGVKNNTIKGGKITNCDGYAVSVSNSSTGSKIDGVTMSNCKGNGVSVNTANSTTICNNQISSCGKRGINVSNSKYMSIYSNTVSNCADLGLSVNSASSATTLKSNTLVSNGGSYALVVSSDSSAPVSSLKSTVLNSSSVTTGTIGGTAHQSKTVKVYNGSAGIGTGSSNSSGSFSVNFTKPSDTATLMVATGDSQGNRAADTFKFVTTNPDSVKLNKTSFTCGVGESCTLSATVSPSIASQTCSWSSSNTAVATVSAGKVTAKGVGTAVITAKTTNGKTAVCNVTVKPAPTTAGVNPSSITLGSGETYIITESTNSGSYAGTFSWSSSNNSVATVAKTSGNKAKITAKGTGSATITFKTYNGKTAFCKVTVKPAPTSVKLNITSLTFGVGEEYVISAGTNSGSWSTDYLWSSSNTSVATVAKTTANKAKIVTKGTGAATITVKTYNGKTTTCKVTVKPAPTSVKLNSTNLTFGVGEEYVIAAGTNSGSWSTDYLWSSSNTSVATVTKTTANKAKIVTKGTGTATITVNTYNGKTATCKVNVKPAPSYAALSVSKLTLGKGETYIISESTDSGSWATNFTWSSSNTSVATVVKTSGNKAKITAKGTGSATVTFKTYNGKIATCKVTVKPAPTSVKLNSTSLTFGTGEEYVISAGTNSGSWSTDYSWSSSNTAVATVAKTTANKAIIVTKCTGTATITVKTYNGKTATCKVTVKPAPTSVRLTTTSLSLNVGETYIIAEGTDSGSWATELNWSSSNNLVATVEKTSGNKAKITAQSKGTAVVTITTYNGKTATCTVTVK